MSYATVWFTARRLSIFAISSDRVRRSKRRLFDLRRTSVEIWIYQLYRVKGQKRACAHERRRGRYNNRYHHSWTVGESMEQKDALRVYLKPEENPSAPIHFNRILRRVSCMPLPRYECRVSKKSDKNAIKETDSSASVYGFGGLRSVEQSRLMSLWVASLWLPKMQKYRRVIVRRSTCRRRHESPRPQLARH